MKEIIVQVSEPSGMKHSDRATLNPTTGTIYVSKAFARFLENLETHESHLWATAVIGTVNVPILFQAVQEPGGTGLFTVDLFVAKSALGTRTGVLTALGDWDRDQRQQFGRFSHTLCASALIGLIGFGHSVKIWSVGSVTGAAALGLAAVLLFLVGIYAVRGELNG